MNMDCSANRVSYFLTDNYKLFVTGLSLVLWMLCYLLCFTTGVVDLQFDSHLCGNIGVY